MKMVERRRKIKGKISFKDSEDPSEFKENILEGFTKIEPKLHHIILSGDYLYEDLKELGELKADMKYVPEGRQPGYKRSAWVSFAGKKLIIYYLAKSNYPRCLITFNYPSVRFLSKLHRKLPELTISSVEYTVDIFCGNPHQVGDLFYLLSHYMYFPYKMGEVQPFGGSFYGYDGKKYQREENAGFHIMTTGKKKRVVAKIYERSDDHKRQKDEKGKTLRSWSHEDVDRVRVEYTFYRKYLQKNGPDELKDLIAHPEFENKIYDMMQFKVFKKSNELPRETEAYWYKNRSGKKWYTQIFQEVYINAPNSGIKNPRQYLEDAEGFDYLKKKLKSAMRKFDRKWVERRKRLFKKHPGLSN